MVHELEKELAQVQSTLIKKEKELEKQQRMTTELEMAIQEAKQNKSKVDSGALRAEIQKLRDCLEDDKQQQKLAGEASPRHRSHHISNPWGRAAPPFSERLSFSTVFLQTLL